MGRKKLTLLKNNEKKKWEQLSGKNGLLRFLISSPSVTENSESKFLQLRTT